jgi:hypothetical protein
VRAKRSRMTSLQASRTLVKSPPELWAELSDLGTLARHLGEFGEIRITEADPESRVEWEADRASGTVRLEPTGWGTRVVLTVQTPEADPVPLVAEAVAVEPEPLAVAAEPEPEPEPVAEVAPEPAAEPPRPGFWARLFRRESAPAEPVAVVAEADPEPVVDEPEPEAVDRSFATIEWEAPAPVVEEPPEDPAPAPLDRDEAHAVLTGVLDTLGAAHHRPFSRS